jgi:phosphatidylglycerophosphate synthase
VLVGEPVAADRLVAQLSGLGVQCEVLADGSVAERLLHIAAVARSSPDGLLVGNAAVITHDSVLGALLTDPRVGSGVLAAGEAGGMPGSWRMRTDRGRVLSVASPFHSVWEPNSSFLGFVKVTGPAVEALASVAERMAAVDWGPDAAEDVPALVAVGLVRSGVYLSQSFVGKLFWARASGPDEVEDALRELASYDEDRVRLDSAVKPVDGFFTTFFVSPYSKYIARWAARRGLTPNVVTSVSMAVGVLAACAFAVGSRAWLIAGAVLLQAAFTLDCVDGQLARYTLTFTRFGAWLDSMFDRGKEYAVFAGLAVGSSRAGDPVWLLAGAALTLQVLRHAFDFSFAASEQKEMGEAPQRPLDDPWDGAGPRPADRASRHAARAGTSDGSQTTALASPPPYPAAVTPEPSAASRILVGWRRLNRVAGLVWIKRMLPFPIGERFAAISITAALFTARTTFTVLIVWGAVASAYTLGGRLLRSFR